MRNGEVTTAQVPPIRWSFDERIEDASARRAEHLRRVRGSRVGVLTDRLSLARGAEVSHPSDGLFKLGHEVADLLSDRLDRAHPADDLTDRRAEQSLTLAPADARFASATNILAAASARSRVTLRSRLRPLGRASAPACR